MFILLLLLFVIIMKENKKKRRNIRETRQIDALLRLRWLSSCVRRCREYNNDDKQTCVRCLCMYVCVCLYVSIKTVVWRQKEKKRRMFLSYFFFSTVY